MRFQQPPPRGEGGLTGNQQLPVDLTSAEGAEVLGFGSMVSGNILRFCRECVGGDC